ncbi:ABC transporter ATP-binding protein [Patescibacteria group bacterium]|nr:ABC transporter ATP-binding protein [Patescibacteria group bacterium]
MVLKNLKKEIPRRRPKLTKPKVTFDRIGQLVFTFKEITKLAAQINKKLLILVFVLNALWGFSAAPGFYLEKLILDRLVESIGDPNWQPVVYAIGFLVGLRLLLELGRSISSSIINYLRRTMSRLFEAKLSLLIGKKLSQLDLATIEDPEFKDKFNKIERESGRRAWGLMMPLSDIPNYLVGFISAVGLLVFLHPLIALGVLIISLPQFFIDQKYIKKEYELNTSLSPLHKLWRWLVYYLVQNRSYMEMKILNLSGYLSTKLEGVQKQVLEKRIELQKKRMLSRFWSFLPLTLFELGVSLWLIFLVITEKVTLGSFEMYLRALRSSEQNLTSLVSSFLEIYENYIYVSELVWFLNLKPKIEGNQKGIKLKKEKRYSITMENVWFRYREENPWVIKDVSLKIEPGERVAIVGENGVGKTTLIKLMARFYDPGKGRILIGDHNLADVKLSNWRSRLGVLFQKFETYPFSARETIGYGDVKRVRNLHEVKDVARKTGIDEYIESLPLAWENPLAPQFEKGVEPSIGQWQRLGISRMLFRKDATVIIMDEPTSNVDPKAEEKIFNELMKKSKDKILIFISQRFSTVRRADRILVMDKGKITEQGTHEELMDKKGLYEELFSLQAKGYH